MDNRDLGKRFDEVFQKMDRAYERYARSILLSDRGRELAAQILPKISRAESRSIQQFSPEEKETFFRLLERFSAAFCEELNG